MSRLIVVHTLEAWKTGRGYFGLFEDPAGVASLRVMSLAFVGESGEAGDSAEMVTEGDYHRLFEHGGS